MRRLFLICGLIGTTALVCSRLSAGEIYIGNAASSGATFSSANRADSVSSLTYIFSSDAYASATAMQVKLDQVNFLTDATGAGSTVIPFVALYDGAGQSLGSSYSLLAQGDTLTAVSGLNNDAFTVGGVHPVVTIPAGGTLVSGEYQSGQVVFFDPGSVSPVDIFTGNVIPGSVGSSFPVNPNFVFTNQSYWYDVGFHAVPEPGSLVLAALGAAGLYLISRRRRKA